MTPDPACPDSNSDVETSATPTARSCTRRACLRTGIGASLLIGAGLPTAAARDTPNRAMQVTPDMSAAWFRMFADGTIRFQLEFSSNLLDWDNAIDTESFFDVSGDVEFNDSASLNWYDPYTVGSAELRAQLNSDGDLTDDEQEFLSAVEQHATTDPEAIRNSDPDEQNIIPRVQDAITGGEFVKTGTITTENGIPTDTDPTEQDITFPSISIPNEYALGSGVDTWIQMPDGYTYRYPFHTIMGYAGLDRQPYGLTTNLGGASLTLDDTEYSFEYPSQGTHGDLAHLTPEFMHTINPTLSLLRASAQRRWLTLNLLAYTLDSNAVESDTANLIEEMQAASSEQVKPVLNSLGAVAAEFGSFDDVAFQFAALAGIAVTATTLNLPAIWVGGTTLLTLTSFYRTTTKAAEQLNLEEFLTLLGESHDSVWVNKLVYPADTDPTRANMSLQTVGALARLQSDYGTKALARDRRPDDVAAYHATLDKQATELESLHGACEHILSGSIQTLSVDERDFVRQVRTTVSTMQESLQADRDLLNEALTAPTTQQSTTAPTTTDQPTTTTAGQHELVAHWRFEDSFEDSAGSYDLSPRDASRQRTFTTQAPEGDYAIGLRGRHLVAQDFYSLDETEPWSVCFWLQDSNSSSDWDDDYIVQYVNPEGGGWGISTTTDGTPFIYTSGSNTLGEATTTVLDGQPHHVCFAHDQPNETMTLYIDGEREYTLDYTDTTHGTSSPTFHIGNQYDGVKDYNGLLDDLRFVTGIISPEALTTITQ